jgi:hypothetical protein
VNTLILEQLGLGNTAFVYVGPCTAPEVVKLSCKLALQENALFNDATALLQEF